MFRKLALILLACGALALPASAQPPCNTSKGSTQAMECLAKKLHDLESELRRAIVLFERHHCPEGWIALEEAKVGEIRGTFRNPSFPLVYCKKLDG